MSAEDIRGLFDKIDVGISIIKDEKIEFANDYFLQIIGYPLSDVINKDCLFYAAKEEKNRLKKIKIENKKNYTFVEKLEFWIQTKDDKRKFIRNHSHLIKEENKKDRYMVLTFDITEKKNRETKVLASEFKKSGFLDYLTEHIIFYDTDMKIIWSNKIASDLLGKAPEDIVGEVCWELWYQSDKPCENCPVTKAIESGQEQIAEVLTPDGNIWNVRGYPVYGDDGTLIGAAELASNITESRITTKELAESEERFKQIFHSVNDGIFVVKRTKEGRFERIIEANDIAVEMYGYTREEFLNMKPKDFNISGEEESLEFANELLEKKKLTFERYHKTKDNQELTVEINSHLYELGSDTVSLAVVRDITERKKAIKELEENEEKFRQIFQNASDAIFIHSMTSDNKLGKFIEVNENACKWTGYTKEQLLMKTPSEVNSPEETVGDSEIGKMLLKHGEVTFEGNIIHKDGSSRPVMYSSHIFEMHGEKAILTTARDLSERKRAEEELISSEQRFRQIFQNINDAIFISKLVENNTRSQFIEVNEVAVRWLGFSKDELLTMGSDDITSSEEKESLPNILKTILEKGRTTFETFLFSKDRKRIPVEISSHLFELQEQQVILSIARDMTERRKARKDLLESEEKYRRLVETIPAAIIRTDSNGIITFVNKQAIELHGYKDENELLGKPMNALVAPEDQAITVITMQRCIEDGYVHDIEYSILCKDGTTIPGEFHAASIKDSSGSVIGFIGVEIDVTERRKAEDELKNSEEKFRQIFQNANDAIFIHEIDQYGVMGNLIEINETACNWLGCSREDLLELVDESANNARNLGYIIEVTDEIFDQEILTFESIIESTTGESKPVEFSSHVFTFKGEKVLLSIARDITERKKAEESVKESEEKYRTLIETSPDAIILLDLDGRISFANLQTAIMFGYDEVEAMLGLTPVDFVVRENLESTNEEIQNIRTNGSSKNIELLAQKKNGTRFPIKLSASLISDNEGNPSAIMGVIEDITERKRSEGALKESEEKFRQTFDQSNDGVILHDLKGNIVDINLRVKELLGYSKTEFLSLTISQLHPITEQETSRKAFEMIEKEGSTNFETVFKRKDGSTFPADVSSSFFEIGGVQVIQGIVRDITERKKAERELVEREEKFRQIFNNARDAIFLTEIVEDYITTSQFTEINDIACVMLEYTREELMQLKSVDITSEEYKEFNTEITKKIINDGTATFETILISKTKKKIPVEVTSHVFTLRDKRVVLSVVRDITERKEAEAKLTESEEKYRQLFHGVNDIIAVISVPRDGSIGTILEINIKALERTNFTREEVIGTKLDQIVKNLTEEEIQIYFQEMLEKDIITFERELIMKSGETFPVEIKAAPFILRDEITVLITARDITERKRDEELKRQAFEQIEQNIEDFAELVDRIRNPLMGVIGYAEISETLHSTIIIEEAKKIEEITKNISDSYMETEEVRKILRKHIFSEEIMESDNQEISEEETEEDKMDESV